jgi:hypothetical protein
MKVLHLSPTLTFPLDAITETFGILAMRGAGKSNTAKVMAEQMYKARLPFVIVDPVGKWWGMRSSADGKSPGLPIPILGGRHGDIPLERTGGAMVADLIVENRLSCILDLFQFSEGDKIRFLTDFCRRLYRKNEEPLHLFMEEADDYCPQVVRANMAELVGAWEDIVRRGRANGLGCTMITQRSQGLNKAVLEQIGTLIVMRTTGPKSRKAIEGWIEHHGKSTEVLASLPSLETGEAWVWSPEWLGIFKRVRINMAETFDSAATPKITKTARPAATLADVDLAAFQVRMAETIERAKDTDPKELKKRVASLEGEIARLNSQALAPLPPVERVEVSVLTDEDRALIKVGAETVTSRLNNVSEKLRAVAEDMAHIADRYAASAATLLERASAASPRPLLPFGQGDPPKRGRGGKPVVTILGSNQGKTKFDPQMYGAIAEGLKAGERRMLTVLAERHPMILSRSQLALLAGRFSMRGGTFNTYFNNLRKLGFIERRGQEVLLTDMGLSAAQALGTTSLGTNGNSVESWMQRLKAGEREMLQALVDVHPRGFQRERLGERLNKAFTGGTFGSYLGTLKRNHLVIEEDGILVANMEVLGGK